MLFAIITYFLSNRLSESQYSSQDMLMEYQSFVLYEMMVQVWNENINDKDQIIKDLDLMKLSAYIGIFNDVNNNQELDLNVDTLLSSWVYKQNKNTFDYNDYESHGVYKVLTDSLQISRKLPSIYASYGFFGDLQIPATFIEFPSKNEQSQLIGYWLITDYPLPPDISWPEIVLVLSVSLILGLTFLIIRTFLKPIQTMIRHVKQLKRGTLNKQIPITTNDELGQLSMTLNKMTDDLNTLVTQKQNLLIDVSHELKTPLTRLKFILANLKLNELDKRSINKEINFLQDMISNMLLSDKLSTPYIEDLEKKEIRLNDLVKNACSMFYQIEKKLTVKIDKKKNPKLFIDPYKMSLAIKNLIDNALKYGNSKKLIELNIVEQVGKIKISVQDFGVGIAKEQINEIIKPLYRGGAAQETNKTGFGLGLAITKKIVEAHNGELAIESNKNRGAKFTIILPKGGTK